MNTKNCVYCAYNKQNRKRYIGYTQTSLCKRVASHYNKAKWRNSSNNYFHNALMKYDKNDFIWYVLFVSESLEKLKDKETELIKLFKTNERRHGYNSTSGGEESHFNDSVKKKISKKAKERNLVGKNNPFFNKFHSEETKKHLSEIRKGKKRNNPGYKHTQKTKIKLSKLRKEICKNPIVIDNMRNAQKSKSVIHLQSGLKYISINEASRQLKINKSTIRQKALKNVDFRFCS